MARKCLHEAMEIVRIKRPMELVAFVLLPEHIHTVWTLPQGDAGYPMRWKRIKEEFTRAYLTRGGTEVPPSLSRSARASGVFGSGDTGNTLCATRKT